MAKSVTDLLKRLWNFFASMKLAILLLLIITGLSLFGTFAAPVTFFQTGWFLVPGLLLMLNILVCSLNRWQGITSRLQGGKVRQPEAFFMNAEEKSLMADLSGSPAELAAAATVCLRKRRFRVRQESENGIQYLAADKNRFFILGTFVSHLSLILFVLAYLIGSAFGFRDTGFVVAEQETRLVGHDTGLSLQLLSFTDDYYADQTPMDYRSEIVLYEDGKPVRQATVRVNHPLIYQGTRFYQSFFGPAVQIRLKQPGQAEAVLSVALPGMATSQGDQRPVGTLDLTVPGMSLRFTSSAVKGTDRIIPKGQLAVELLPKNQQTDYQLLALGQTVKISDIEITYLAERQYSGFQISRDPGNILVWLAAALFVLGMTAVLFFVHLQLWVQIKPLPTGKSRLIIQLNAPRGFSQASESQRILAAVRQAAESNQ